MSLFTRIHEWAADRFDSVQYPRARPVPADQRTADAASTRFFKYSMPAPMRILLASVSLIAIVVCVAVLLVMLVVFKAVFFG